MKDTKSFAIELIHLLGIAANDFTVKGVTDKLEDFMKAQELSYTNDVNTNLKDIGTLEDRGITVAEAVNRIIDEINRDKGLYVAYHANIAMAFKDEFKNYQGILKDSISPGVISSIANNAATTFLQMWTDSTHKPIIGHTEEELIEIHQAWYQKGYQDCEKSYANLRDVAEMSSEAWELLDELNLQAFTSLSIGERLEKFFKKYPNSGDKITQAPAGGMMDPNPIKMMGTEPGNEVIDFKLYQQKGKEQASDKIIEDVCCFLDRLKMKVNTKSSSKDTYQAFHDQYTLNDRDIQEIILQVGALSAYLKQYSKAEGETIISNMQEPEYSQAALKEQIFNCKIQYEHLNNELVLFSKKNTELENQLTRATDLLKRGLNAFKDLNKDSSNQGDNTCNVRVVKMWVLLDWSEAVAKFIKASGIQDIKDTESSEKEAFNKKLPRAHGKTPGFIEYLDLWVDKQYKAVSWEVYSLSVSPTALNEAYAKAVKDYRLFLEDETKPKNIFVHPKLAPNNAAGKAHTLALQKEGYAKANSVAYDTDSGLRILIYKTTVCHISISHPDRLPTYRELQWCRDEFYPNIKQMAWVIPVKEKAIGESGNYTIALIELIYV